MRRDLERPRAVSAEDTQMGRALERVAHALMAGTLELTAEQRRMLTRLLTMPGSAVAKHATTRGAGEDPGLF